MFDLNTILSAALTAAVAEATKPLHEAMQALAERVAKLEAEASYFDNRLTAAAIAYAARLEALENRPAIGADTTPVAQTSNVTIPIDEAKMVEALNSQEWFWEKLTRKMDEIATAVAEKEMNQHCDLYDHDGYDDAVDRLYRLDPDEFVKKEDLNDIVTDVVTEELRFTVSVER